MVIQAGVEIPALPLSSFEIEAITENLLSASVAVLGFQGIETSPG